MRFKNDVRKESDDTHIVSFDWKNNPCEWWCTPTGNRKGNDNHMEYEFAYTLYVGQHSILSFSRYRSEYSDDKIEFQNTMLQLNEKDFGDVIEKMSY